MIRTIAVTKNRQLIEGLPLEELKTSQIDWYWVDFESPTEEEKKLLESYFHFHPLAIEDCLQFLQRPKLDYYDGYNFFVLHSLNQDTLLAEEVDLFVSSQFIVSFQLFQSSEIELVRQELISDPLSLEKGPFHIMYRIIDKIVDYYFPTIYKIEDRINEIDNSIRPIHMLMDEVFDLRSQLLTIRHTIFPMRDLLYRIINSERLEIVKEQHIYFTDIYDHLLKLTEMIESNREVTSDIRDSYLSLSSNRMNTIMMTLTVITTIFMPLTFIAGVYGMNFKYMPELNWHYGYFITLGFMGIIALSMYFWFKHKGWF
ncbi:magnesium/cobalt transporter CorA [Tepidibacillus infernus]|uniref:Magnesium transport protein CorA n=1 Tax=Tepidibacillus decaturensis TaxID=1413211 RepID=A0A135L0M9_9BACI|nr:MULTISPECIES: magnesium/cobalt transporter CorA [Tepidibacillus]KXG42541.1 metal transporter [Tepidibacillus decaturensis]GBF11903.1 magnesium transport protein CorA [Tepidibacillus sp. HK-1]